MVNVGTASIKVLHYYYCYCLRLFQLCHFLGDVSKAVTLHDAKMHSLYLVGYLVSDSSS